MKETTSIRIDPELRERAKKLGFNVSGMAQKALEEKIIEAENLKDLTCPYCEHKTQMKFKPNRWEADRPYFQCLSCGHKGVIFQGKAWKGSEVPKLPGGCMPRTAIDW